jgi:phenylalanyl-tRNA synthetase beta chain
MKISYNWLKSYVPDIPEPHHLADLFTYHVCEVESVDKLDDGDFLFDLGILPNRAHDLLSHQGVAKELAGLLGIAFKDPTPMYKTPASSQTALAVEIQTPSCRRYTARIVRNVNVDFSPDWMKKHLESIGQRSINNVVDATNIVMYDLGQPTHAFDLDKISGNKIVIAPAVSTEKVTLLDNKEVELDPSVMTIRDEKNALALAGVKGGKPAEVTTQTKNILIEVANFDPVSVRKTARRLGLLTDSAKRFENDLSPGLCDKAMFDLSALLLELFPGATFEDVVDVYPLKPESHMLSFTTDTVNKHLGAQITSDEIEAILKKYSYEFTTSENTFTIAVPPLRLDLVIAENMIEEIGRVYGYDKLTAELPVLDFIPQKNEAYEKIVYVRNALVGQGYQEVMTYAFVNTGDTEVLASASDKKFLRTNLSDGLKKSYEMNRLNMQLLGLNEIKIFEIGTVFKGDNEVMHIGYADKKGVIEATLDHFVKTSHEESSTQIFGSPLQSQANEKARPDYSSNLSSYSVFTPWSLYPFIARDIAVWVPDGTEPGVLSDIYEEFGAEILRGKPTLFDQFTKAGRTSYAFRLLFQAYDRTLTDDEVSVIMSHITEKITTLGYEPR